MYIPSSFAVLDTTTLHNFIESHSFASLTTLTGDGLVTSHLPLLLDRHFGTCGKLIGHMARANDQWQEASNAEALVVFHGPHAYISPSWYEANNVVPTWNYVAVHVYGKLHIISDRDVLLQTLGHTVEKYEGSATQPWSIDQPDDSFIDGLLASIVGFEIEITRIEGKWKLSQNHTTERRLRVVDALRKRGGEQSSAIADLMESTLEEPSE